VVSPGPVDTAIFDAATDEVREALTDESSFITGAELCIDGGMAQV
jgi:NAD(P)-dependent dehydrogenase (short-subunit alcohol dehydrogenase family)